MLLPSLDTRCYGFGGRLTVQFPSQLIVDVTERCNLACTHCPHASFQRSTHYRGRFLEPALNTKAVEEVAQFGKGATQQVRYTAEGEPLLHPRIFDMLEEAVRNSGTFVSFTTNGTLLTAERSERLLATRISLIDVSLDAYQPDTYARIRVGGQLRNVTENLRRLVSLNRHSGSRTRIVVSYIEQPDNAGETADFTQFWTDEGVDSVVVRRQHSAAGGIAALASTMRSVATGVARRPCVYPWERIVLNPRGMLSFCPADWTSGSGLGDYRTTTIRETWRGAAYEQLRRAHLTNDYSGHQFCAQCPDWQQMRWPHEGASYATLVERFRDNA